MTQGASGNLRALLGQHIEVNDNAPEEQTAHLQRRIAVQIARLEDRR